jgi:hypothetical protein
MYSPAQVVGTAVPVAQAYVPWQGNQPVAVAHASVIGVPASAPPLSDLAPVSLAQFSAV